MAVNLPKSLALKLFRFLVSIYQWLLPNPYRTNLTYGVLGIVARPVLARKGNRVQTEKYTLCLDSRDVRSVVHFVYYHVYKTWFFEPFEISLFLQSLSLNPRSVVVDIGANYGAYTLEACSNESAARFKRLMAVEPDRIVSSCLSRSVKENGFQEKVLVLNAAVSDQHGGSCELFVNKRGSDDNRTIRHGEDINVAESYSVPTVTIDGLVRDNGIEESSKFIIKADIQGNEPLAVAGMQKALKSAAGYQLLLEFDPVLLESAGHDAMEFARLLYGLEADFRAEIREESGTMIPIEDVGRIEEIVRERRSTDFFISRNMILPFCGNEPM